MIYYQEQGGEPADGEGYLIKWEEFLLVTLSYSYIICEAIPV